MRIEHGQPIGWHTALRRATKPTRVERYRSSTITYANYPEGKARCPLCQGRKRRMAGWRSIRCDYCLGTGLVDRSRLR